MPFVLGDDFLYALKFPSEGFIGSSRIENLGDYFESLINHYNNYNNRILPHALLQFILLCPPYIFDFINAVMFMALPYVVLKPFFNVGLKENSKSNFSKRAMLYFSVLLFLWCFHYDLGRSYFWTTGSINYTWFLVFQLMYLGQLYNSVFGKYNLNGLTIILSLLICTSNENVVLSLFVLTVGLILYKRINAKISVENAVYISALVLFFGGVLMLCSPALGLRIENETLGFGNFYFRLLEFLKRQAYYILCGLSALIFIIPYKLKRLQYSKILFFGIVIFLSSAIMFMAPIYEPRSSIFAYVVFLMFVLSCIDLSSLQNKGHVYFLAVIGLILIPERIDDVCNARINYNENIQSLTEKPNSSNVVLNGFCEDYQMSIAVCDELSSDENKFENKVLSAYLGKEKLVYQNKNKVRLHESFLRNYKAVISNQDSFGYVRVDQKLTDHFHLKGIYKNDKEYVFEIESSSITVASDDLAYILRGVRKTNLRHRLIRFFPSFLGKYFLSFLESNTILTDGKTILFHNVLATEEYDSFIFALYDKQNHTTFGNHIVIEN